MSVSHRMGFPIISEFWTTRAPHQPPNPHTSHWLKKNHNPYNLGQLFNSHCTLRLPGKLQKKLNPKLFLPLAPCCAQPSPSTKPTESKLLERTLGWVNVLSWKCLEPLIQDSKCSCSKKVSIADTSDLRSILMNYLHLHLLPIPQW